MRTLDEIKAGPLLFYSFVNYYLSDLQRGLQTAHVVADMFIKYDYLTPQENHRLHFWARNNKTIIILNGGNSKNLLDIIVYYLVKVVGILLSDSMKIKIP